MQPIRSNGLIRSQHTTHEVEVVYGLFSDSDYHAAILGRDSLRDECQFRMGITLGAAIPVDHTTRGHQ